MEEEILGVEEQEFAEPETEEESEESPEFAEPEKPERDLQKDMHFAQMRRETQNLQRELAKRDEVLGLFFDGEDKLAQAQAYYYNKTPQEIREEQQRQAQQESMEQENEILKSQLLEIQIQSSMEEDLAQIQKIDQSVKSLHDLGEGFFKLIATGKVDAEQAYYAVKAKEIKNAKNPPMEIGELGMEKPRSGFYTKEEVEGMSAAQVSKHYEKIRNSMSRW